MSKPPGLALQIPGYRDIHDSPAPWHIADPLRRIESSVHFSNSWEGRECRSHIKQFEDNPDMMKVQSISHTRRSAKKGHLGQHSSSATHALEMEPLTR